MSGTRRCCSRRPAVIGDNSNGYVETDPTGRYGRFDELMGKGAMKSVYRGFDEERGVEVAWNQAVLADVVRSPEAVQRMYSEVQLLSQLRHDAIIGFLSSWVDVRRRTFNFITELFSSGTLRAYRLRYPRVSLRAVRSWARQILRGLAYLHGRRPPVIHRDLKCDNIFVNGHQGQVKIGDLGLAAVLREAGQPARSVIGTPEFMAPEMYDEEYNELVDVYSFGMCMLEMLTTEYPYSECTNPAQIYKKVTAGKLPDAFYRVDDDDARRFIGRCLVAVDRRPSAAELLLDPFLLDDHYPAASPRSAAAVMLPLQAPEAALPPPTCSSSDASSMSDVGQVDEEDDDEQVPVRTDMTISGKLNSDGDTIFLKVQIADETGQVRNIYFPFDVAGDTATEVAKEMVKELDITDRDAAEIAAMIEEEVSRLVPASRELPQQHEYTYALDDDDDYSCHYGGLSDDESGVISSGHQYHSHHQVGGGRTRFSGEGGTSSSRSTSPRRTGDLLAQQLQRQCSLSPHAGRPRRREQRGRMTRNRSMVDLRSQLLHRTLVEELNRRLFFNTVGAVENIGFRVPQYSPPPSSSSSSAARRSRDDQHRYYI